MNFFNELKKSIKILKDGKILLYPTDTVWGIGCDFSKNLSIQKIFSIKKRNIFKSMILLVETPKRLSELVKVPKIAWELIYQTKKPLTIIYKNCHKKTPNIFYTNKKQTLAIRITKDPFCKSLIKNFNKPIISTSANISGKPSPLSFNEIDLNIINKVDYIVNLRRKEKAKYIASSIIELVSEDEIQVLRK